MYMLGYADDGRATGVSPSELSASIKTLRVMTAAVGAKIANMQVCILKVGGRFRICLRTAFCAVSTDGDCANSIHIYL